MKYVRVPPQSVTLVSDATGLPLVNEQGDIEPVTFSSFVRKVLLRDAKAFGENIDALDARQSIIDALDNIRDGICAIENDAYKRLMQSCIAPTTPFVPQIAGQFMPYFRALRSARDSVQDL